MCWCMTVSSQRTLPILSNLFSTLSLCQCSSICKGPHLAKRPSQNRCTVRRHLLWNAKLANYIVQKTMNNTTKWEGGDVCLSQHICENGRKTIRGRGREGTEEMRKWGNAVGCSWCLVSSASALNDTCNEREQQQLLLLSTSSSLPLPSLLLLLLFSISLSPAQIFKCFVYVLRTHTHKERETFPHTCDVCIII